MWVTEAKTGPWQNTNTPPTYKHSFFFDTHISNVCNTHVVLCISKLADIFGRKLEAICSHKIAIVEETWENFEIIKHWNSNTKQARRKRKNVMAMWISTNKAAFIAVPANCVWTRIIYHYCLSCLRVAAVALNATVWNFGLTWHWAVGLSRLPRCHVTCSDELRPGFFYFSSSMTLVCSCRPCDVWCGMVWCTNLTHASL